MDAHIPASDYLFLRGFLREQMGYELGEGKEYLVESRLNPIAAAFGLSDVAGLVRRLRDGCEQSMREAVVEAMTISETSFYRTPRTFEGLRKQALPALIKARGAQRVLRIWCAACSTGQEPYSIAMMLLDDFPELRSWQVDLLATDISEQALERARQGVYSQFEVQRGLRVQALLKHFQKDGEQWRISENVRRRVELRRFNLLDSFLGVGGPFDVIFLRNVLIYFDPVAKTALFDRLRHVIAADGYLFLGEAETILGLTKHFKLPEQSADYCRPEAIRR